MEMKHYLLETFDFNDQANRTMIEKIRELPDREEAIKYISHIINSQNKWMTRILQDAQVSKMSWWSPVYELDHLEAEWNKSLKMWQEYIRSKSDEELGQEVTFEGHDGTLWAASPKDIALQLNYHSIHHRAQIQVLIRKQGVVPDFIDYIGTKYRKI